MDRFGCDFSVLEVIWDDVCEILKGVFDLWDLVGVFCDKVVVYSEVMRR